MVKIKKDEVTTTFFVDNIPIVVYYQHSGKAITQEIIVNNVKFVDNIVTAYKLLTAIMFDDTNNERQSIFQVLYINKIGENEEFTFTRRELELYLFGGSMLPRKKNEVDSGIKFMAETFDIDEQGRIVVQYSPVVW